MDADDGEDAADGAINSVAESAANSIANNSAYRLQSIVLPPPPMVLQIGQLMAPLMASQMAMLMASHLALRMA